MTEKDLISKLNNLKQLQPNKEWLVDNRALFLAQISNSGANKLSAWESFYINFKSFTKASSQPVFALGIFLFVLVVSSIFGHTFFSEAKPNDSLYIARVISEKAKLSTVIDTQERNKMAVKFAANHAKDISMVLDNPDFNNEDNKDQVAKLSEDFNREMDTVKNRMVVIAAAKQTKEVAPKQSGSTYPELASGTSEFLGESTSTAEEIVSIATDLDYKEEIGIQISINEEEIKTEEKSEIEVINPAEEAKLLFEKKEYKNVVDKLEEVSELIK